MRKTDDVVLLAVIRPAICYQFVSEHLVNFAVTWSERKVAVRLKKNLNQPEEFHGFENGKWQRIVFCN